MLAAYGSGVGLLSAFVIKARTDAAATDGIDEAIRRGNLYADAGADLVFADALLSEDDIRSFARRVDAPVSVNMGLGLRARATTPLIPARELEKMGVAVVIYPRLLTTAAVRGMQLAMSAMATALASDTVIEAPDLQVSFSHRDLVRWRACSALCDPRWPGAGRCAKSKIASPHSRHVSPAAALHCSGA